MGIIAFEGVVDKGQIRLKSKVLLPDQIKVYVMIPDFEVHQVQLVSPRLAHPEQAADFKKEVIELVSDADV